MEPHSWTTLRKIEDGDLDRYMRLAGSKDVIDTARAVHDDNCFILHDEDGLVKHLSGLSFESASRCTVRMSMSCAGAGGGEGGGPSRGGYKIMFVQGRKGGGERERRGARLASETKEGLARAQPGRRLRMLNLGLGVTVFAAMSATSLVAISPPLSYVFAAGALAPAGIMLVRAARGHA